MSANTPAYTTKDGKKVRTSFQYAITIHDGTRSYSPLEKTVEVFKPLGNSGVKDFYLRSDSGEVVQDGGALFDVNYDLIFNIEGSDFTARKNDLTYTVSDPYFHIVKEQNGMRLEALNPRAVGDSMILTVTSEIQYNQIDLDSSWSPSITLKRRFIYSPTHLNKIRDFPAETYRFLDGMTYNNWTPIPEFSGTIDGNQCTITLTITKNEGQIGFVGENKGTIHDLNIKAKIYSYSDSSSYRDVGVIAGVNTGTIDSCCNWRYYSEDSSCSYDAAQGKYFSSNVDIYVGGNSSVSSVGGIAGTNRDGINGKKGTINNCHNYAHIFSRGDTGGITGTSTGVVSNSASDGKIHYLYYQDNRSCGGIVGYQLRGTISSVTNNSYIYFENQYSTSRNLQPGLGQICGHKSNVSTVENYYCDGYVDIGSLHTETWQGGFLNMVTYKHDQALYAKNEAFGVNEPPQSRMLTEEIYPVSAFFAGGEID